jgi:hypothetical protein
VITNEGVPQLCDLIDAKICIKWAAWYGGTSFGIEYLRHLAPELLDAQDESPHTPETDMYALGGVGLKVNDHRSRLLEVYIDLSLQVYIRPSPIC